MPPPDRHRRLPEWPVLVVLTLVAVGLAMAADGYVRRGPALIGVAALLAAALRLALPPASVGLLAVRRRAVDVIVLAVLGTATLALSLVIRASG